MDAYRVDRYIHIYLMLLLLPHCGIESNKIVSFHKDKKKHSFQKKCQIFA